MKALWHLSLLTALGVVVASGERQGQHSPILLGDTMDYFYMLGDVMDYYYIPIPLQSDLKHQTRSKQPPESEDTRAMLLGDMVDLISIQKEGNLRVQATSRRLQMELANENNQTAGASQPETTNDSDNSDSINIAFLGMQYH